MFRYIENLSTAYGTHPSQAEFSGAAGGPTAGRGHLFNATLCSGNPSCGKGSTTWELHESQKASGMRRPGPGLVESVAEEAEEVGAVQSAGGEEVGRWTGATKDW